MRKKIFIIHGKGVNRGIGKEGGGDLDTVSSSAFYMVWAKNALKEELGREPVYGEDFEVDFINYSEGVSHLAVHSGCDIYLPDFPIDALTTRMKMLVMEEEESVGLINRFTREINEFKLWIIRNADKVSEDLKGIFNATFKQIPKVLEHQEKAALLTALNILEVIRHVTELEVLDREEDESVSPEFLAGYMKGVVANLTGNKLKDLKKSLKAALNDTNKEKMIDKLVKKGGERENIIAFDKAMKRDMSTNGRVNYTDELIIVMVEMIAYLIRGLKQLRDLPWDDKLRESYSLILSGIGGDLKRHLRVMMALGGALPADSSEKVKGLIAGIDEACNRTIEIISGIEGYVPGAAAEEKDYPIRIMLTEEATGKAVPGIEIVVKRLEGSGSFILPDGSSSSDETVIVSTDERGTATLKYQPAAPDERYRFSATFDNLQEVFLPSDVPPPDSTLAETFDEIGSEMAEEEFDEKEPEEDSGVDRALKVTLTVIERQFRKLRENDVIFTSLDDHHPYTQEIFDLLKRLEGEGIIKHIQIQSLPRGQELPIEEQTCGSALVYKDRIEGKPWDNPGLAELRRIAILQDLHIELEPLALELSKLIGSKFSKVEMATGLAEGIKDYDSMRNIMQSTGWDKKVEEYEAGLEKVLPRTEQILGRIDFHKPDNEDAKVRIMAAISPFCDAKKGETQINVASAIGYWMGKKGYPADYIFYCYGSHLMTTRKPNEEETSLNLSTVCQAMGTKADGGHSGAATCKPASNPNFPTERLDKVRDTNFLEYLEYLGKVVADFSGLKYEGVSEVPVEEYTGPIEQALKHVAENTFEINLEKKDNPDDKIRVLFTRAPKVNKKAGDEKPSFLQVVNYLKRTQEFDYLVFSQGMMYRVVLCNTGDPQKRLDLPALARLIGWSEDGGNDVLAVADIKKNPKVKKRLRKLLGPHLVQLASMIAAFIEEGSDYRVSSVRPIFFDGVEERATEVCKRMDADTYVIDLASQGGEGKEPKLRLVATLSPSIVREKGEFEPSLPLTADHFKNLNPDYLIYSEHELSFPRTDQIMVLMRAEDSSGSINCSEAVAAGAGKMFLGDDKIAECMPKFIKGTPVKKLAPNSYREYLEFIIPKMAEAVGYTVDSFRALSEI
ncbi:MAG: hypothetical protein RAO92_08825 [Candidatus Euphemobacter frigidus]|nr:hypothetical protein [Candidatus Euphemobacter frigidus]MDP8276489.1 hypothetical protein [Candidatus Euphemobacter frigidus]